MQKWEYCAVIFSPTGQSELLYFSSGGVEEREIRGYDTMGAQINQLGTQGWELVGCGNGGETYHNLYFKRLLAE